MDKLSFLAEVPTFCLADGSLDTGAVRLCIRRLLDAGYAHIAVAGFAGEYESLTLADQHTLISCAVDAAAGRAAIAAGAFDAGTEKAAARIREHEKLGCHLHLCIASHYFGLANEEELIRHIAVLRCAGEGLWLADSPAHTGFALPLHALQTLTDCGAIQGFALNVPDVRRLAALHALGDTLAPEEAALSGCPGVLGVHSRLAFLFPRLLRRWPALSGPVRQALLSILDSGRHPAAAVKYAAWLMKLCRYPGLLPPAAGLTPEEKAAIEAAVRVAGAEEVRLAHEA